jgi:two-component system sensor histidine kinase KdpD
MQWKSRKLDLHLASDLPPINIDAVLMERVLWNLIENAIKYSPETEPVSIDVTKHDSEMVISVCDYGSGIPETQIEVVFETFHRGQQESVIPGVGLGLAIAKSIVDAHGGKLKYRRLDGSGSCFSIHLPLGQPPCFDESEDLV